MARRDREINIFNIAFLDVITGAMGAFVLLVVLLAPYYTGSDPRSRKAQEQAQSAVNDAQQNVQQAQDSASQSDQQTQQALAQAQKDLATAKEQLDALKQQLDQLTSQNKRLSALDDQQQQQLKQAQQQIDDLQQQAEQSTQQALDRAEQNMQQADQAMQTDDVDKLKRLLAQARADLEAARQQLDALSKELDQAHKDLRNARDQIAALEQQLNQANAEIDALKSQLQRVQDALEATERQRDQAIAEARQAQQALATAQQQRDQAAAERDQAAAERDQARSQAGALSQTLNKAAPVPAVWALLEVLAKPTCAQTSFEPVPRLVAVKPMADTYGLNIKDANAFRGRGLFLQSLVLGWADQSHFSRFYVVTMPDTGSKLYFGVAATSPPAPGCSVQVNFSVNTDLGNGQTNHLSWAGPIAPMHDTRPVLFGVVPPSNPNDALPTTSEIATYARDTSNGAQQ
jgi:predicted  nucleic acid-binding Zn-ribbon protein